MQVAATKQMTNLEVIKGAIAAKIDSAAFSSWIAPLVFEISNNTLTLVAQNMDLGIGHLIALKMCD